MVLPNSLKLDIKYLSRLFDNMSECYKLFWFQAIVDEVCLDNVEITYEKLIDNMIADAWYMVSEYHLNLGPNDTLEKLVKYSSDKSGLKSSEKREVVIDTLYGLNDVEITKMKRTLTYNVPYRLQAPFLSDINWSQSAVKVARSINSFDNIIYKFLKVDGLNSVIVVDNSWVEYIKENQEIIKGWINYNLIKYLQRRNPSVPGISNKLTPPQERNLTKVKKYWESVIAVLPVFDIYGHIDMSNERISIDHFIPWSYVTHDELWNLTPTTRSINSSKSNNLPEWNKYFKELSKLEYEAYKTVWEYDKVHKEFDKCVKEHINSIDVEHKLYREGLKEQEFVRSLEEIIKPVYDAAMNLGFSLWSL